MVRTTGILTSIALALFAGPAPAQTISPPRHELVFGFGFAASGESDIFNVPGDISSKPKLVLNLAYRLYAGPTLGFGIHTFGGTETTDAIGLIDPSGSLRAVNFDLNTYNSGVHVILVRPHERLRFYAAAGLSYAYGTIDSGLTGSLNYSGFSAHVAPGLSFRLADRFAAAVEGLASFGKASWDEVPFANSSGDGFDPSLYGVLLSFSIPWGDASRSGLSPLTGHPRLESRE